MCSGGKNRKDDYSNFRSVHFVKTKDEIKHCVGYFINKAENITGNRVNIFRTDNGLEFVNKELKEILSRWNNTPNLCTVYL